MGHQIIQQPDGLFCIFSPVTHNIIKTDLTKIEVLEYFAVRGAMNAYRDADNILRKIEAGREPYYQFTLTYEEAVAQHQAGGGSAGADQLRGRYVLSDSGVEATT